MSSNGGEKRSNHYSIFFSFPGAINPSHTLIIYIQSISLGVIQGLCAPVQLGITSVSVSCTEENKKIGQKIIPFHFPLWLNSCCYYFLSHLYYLLSQCFLSSNSRCGLCATVQVDITIVSVFSEEEQTKWTNHYSISLSFVGQFLVLLMPLAPSRLILETSPLRQIKMWPLHFSLRGHHNRQCF